MRPVISLIYAKQSFACNSCRQSQVASFRRFQIAKANPVRGWKSRGKIVGTGGCNSFICIHYMALINIRFTHAGEYGLPAARPHRARPQIQMLPFCSFCSFWIGIASNCIAHTPRVLHRVLKYPKEDGRPPPINVLISPFAELRIPNPLAEFASKTLPLRLHLQLQLELQLLLLLSLRK